MRRLLIIFGSKLFQDAADNKALTPSLQFACRTDAAWEGGGGAGAPGFALVIVFYSGIDQKIIQWVGGWVSEIDQPDPGPQDHC